MSTKQGLTLVAACLIVGGLLGLTIGSTAATTIGVLLAVLTIALIAIFPTKFH